MTATTVDLVKYHGLGNDFFVALRGEDWVDVGSALARAVCDRHLGFGADGLLLVLASQQPASQVRMRLHNANGSVAEMSGNGIRCFVHACLDGGIVGPGRVSIETDAGERIVEAGASDENGIAQISVDMGTLAFDTLPVLGGVPGEAVTVDVGNPHLVVATEERDIAAWGPKLEHAYLTGPTFGINVEFVIMLEPGVVEMLVWERGVGVTQACGTGAAAVAGAAARWGWDRSGAVTVRQPGGTAQVVLDGDRATLIGPSQRIGSFAFEWYR